MVVRMSVSIFERGGRWSVRVSFPEDRWADIGRVMGATSSIRRDICRTLETSSRREAEERKLGAATAIRTDVDAKLILAKLRPLTDWTAEWMARAVARRSEMQVAVEADTPDYERDSTYDAVEADLQAVRRRRGNEAARMFETVATGQGMTVAEAARQWLAEERPKVLQGTIASHEAALKRLGQFLEREKMPSLEGVALSAVTRRMAGELLSERRASAAWETVMRDFSAYSGLWRWAIRRGHTVTSPWPDQTSGMKGRQKHDDERGEKRGYSAGELVKLLRAGATELAPGRGGYAATFWDLIRLSLLTGGRASETLSLRVRDVLEDGTAVVFSAEGGKTENAPRIMPLHPFAARVVADRLASLPDRFPDASLWPEVPETGLDRRRSKIISNRYPPIRRRILGDDDGADFHSFRRSLITAGETAIHEGGRLNIDLLHLLDGHKRPGLSLGLYSDWSRMGRAGFRGALGDRLKTLRDAVEDIVALGFDQVVKVALEETAGARPGVVRTAPAFKRHHDAPRTRL